MRREPLHEVNRTLPELAPALVDAGFHDLRRLGLDGQVKALAAGLDDARFGGRGWDRCDARDWARRRAGGVGLCRCCWRRRRGSASGCSAKVEAKGGRGAVSFVRSAKLFWSFSSRAAQSDRYARICC